MNTDGIGRPSVDNRDLMGTEPSNALTVKSESGGSISPPASVVESVFSRVSSSSQYSVDLERHGILIYWMYPNQPSFWEDMAPIERVSLMTPFTDNLFYHELRRRAGFSRVRLIEGRFVKVLSFTIQQPPGPGGIIAIGRMELVDIVSTVHQLAIENSDGGRAVSRIEELGYHHNPVVILVELLFHMHTLSPYSPFLLPPSSPKETSTLLLHHLLPPKPTVDDTEPESDKDSTFSSGSNDTDITVQFYTITMTLCYPSIPFIG
ncbi:hypothetical protein TWF788_007312 [Orbilia oligospora]|uniref:Uncharacterized protein n=1 Tax=Orbilia oligospora TaxID=2813651 RepID=A0A6G1LR74_ORBOL|nr:hypothetical protein TWF788_007312 [Orbilia oligospora]KAF3211064.1 hypothetical protein TWF679_006555 [Orbilia oligospora]KAF3217376.1 hypothetical protein TWF191_008544 [Orbilia oligospora]KAF3230735.1 hypothetical protein TWF192_004352 [Orbilia oligospora]